MIIRKVALGMTLVAILSMIQALPVHAYEIGTDVGAAYYRWKEHVAGGTVKESGAIWTIDEKIAAAPFGKVPQLRLGGGVQVFFGRVDFDTFIQGTGAPVNLDTDYFGLKFEGTAGWRITYGETSVEPFLGLTYRTWWRDILNAYLEWYRNLAARVGILAEYGLNNDITLYTTFSLDPMLWAEEKIYVGDTFTVKNGRRLGWEIEWGARVKKFNGALYWQATRLGTSNKVTCFGIPENCSQPKSDQDIIGLKLGYVF